MVIKIYQRLINPRVYKMSLSKFKLVTVQMLLTLQPSLSVSNATTIDLRVLSFQKFSGGACP